MLALSHEYVHALQDVSGDLTNLRASVNTSDGLCATTSVAEGEATYLSVTGLSALPMARSPFPWQAFLDDLRVGTAEAIQSSPSPFTAALEQLPYVVGTAYFVARAGDGDEDLRQLYAFPPHSLWELRARTQPNRGDFDDSQLACLPTSPPAGMAAVTHDRLGMAGLFALIVGLGFDREGRNASLEDAWDWAAAGQTDTVVIFQESSGEGRVAMAWRLRFGDGVVAGRLASFLRGAGDWEVRQEGDRHLTLLAADDGSLVADWEPGCGDEDELPNVSPPMMMQSSRMETQWTWAR